MLEHKLAPMKGSLESIEKTLESRGFTCVKKGKEDFWTMGPYFAEIEPRADKSLGFIMTIRRSTYF